MDKKPLIGVSICAVVLLILASLSNVVGYQQVHSSNTKTIKEYNDQKELLFQTICDITNNKKIQSIIYNYEIKGDFENSLLSSLMDAKSLCMYLGMRFNGLSFPVKIITKEYMQHAYMMGVILSRIIDTLKITLLLRNSQIVNQEMQREIAAVIEQDSTLKEKITRLSSSECGCENDNTTQWTFPIICTILFPMFVFAAVLFITGTNPYLIILIGDIAKALSCFWAHIVP